MSVELQEQRVRYVGNGTAKTFPFAFTIEEPSQVQVVRADAKGTESTLVLNQDYSVALNADGTGSVTLAQALPRDFVLALVSNIEIDQERAFYNNTPYYQEQIEGGLDKLTRICQQLHELAMRHLTVPATSTRTPQEVMHSILTIADQANAYLSQVVKIRDDVIDLKNNAQALITQTGDEQSDRVELVGDAEAQEVAEVGQQWQDTVSEEGQIQLDRLAGYADVGALAEGLAAACQVWTLTKDVPAGSTIVLPNELQYIPGHHHLWLSYGGIVLSPSFFTEVGDGKAPSAEFITNVTFKAGQELMAWVIPLGKAYEVELTERIVALEEALMDLSRRVVYADVEE